MIRKDFKFVSISLNINNSGQRYRIGNDILVCFRTLDEIDFNDDFQTFLPRCKFRQFKPLKIGRKQNI